MHFWIYFVGFTQKPAKTILFSIQNDKHVKIWKSAFFEKIWKKSSHMHKANLREFQGIRSDTYWQKCPFSFFHVFDILYQKQYGFGRFLCKTIKMKPKVDFCLLQLWDIWFYMYSWWKLASWPPHEKCCYGWLHRRLLRRYRPQSAVNCSTLWEQTAGSQPSISQVSLKNMVSTKTRLFCV